MRHLKSFHVFHIAAQSASFTEAAERLCLTHGAVSKQIKVLEQYTGQQLFERKGRQMHLTNPGQLLQNILKRHLMRWKKDCSSLNSKT